MCAANEAGWSQMMAVECFSWGIVFLCCLCQRVPSFWDALRVMLCKSLKANSSLVITSYALSRSPKWDSGVWFTELLNTHGRKWSRWELDRRKSYVMWSTLKMWFCLQLPQFSVLEMRITPPHFGGMFRFINSCEALQYWSEKCPEELTRRHIILSSEQDWNSMRTYIKQ